ncbi:MAG: class I SAM-dependent methyltransferase [Actinobacteria bacterium]|nr:class I SAM-dependent methyltransferase [Actinomycetota bacterium]
MFAGEYASCRSSLWRNFAGHVVLPWALQGLEPNGRLLELGTGSAAMAAGTAARYPGVHVTATDLDPAMVQVAAARLAPYRNATAEQADVSHLPFADASFDVVTSFLMLHHVGDWRGGVEQAYRVLRPGGTFVGYDFTDAFVARALHLHDRTPHRLLHRRDLLAALATAGFARPVVSYGCGRQLMRFITVKPAEPVKA